MELNKLVLIQLVEALSNNLDLSNSPHLFRAEVIQLVVEDLDMEEVVLYQVDTQ
jgi:hypothetical protein